MESMFLDVVSVRGDVVSDAGVAGHGDVVPDAGVSAGSDASDVGVTLCGCRVWAQ